MAEEKQAGTVKDLFARPVVAGIDLVDNLVVGDKIHIVGYTIDINLVIESMQIDNVNVQQGKTSNAVGIKLPDISRQGDTVCKVIE